MSTALDLIGGFANLAMLTLYVYVAFVNYKGERMSGTGLAKSLTLALTWPIFIWKMLRKLYEVRD